MRSYLLIGLVVCSGLVHAKQYQYQTEDLFEAIKIGHKKDVKQYLKLGVDVNSLDEAGKTVLDYAIENQNKKSVLMLLKQHAKVTTEQNLKNVQQMLKKRSFWLMLFGIPLLLIAGLGTFMCTGLWGFLLVLPTAFVYATSLSLVIPGIRLIQEYDHLSMFKENTIVIS